MDDDTCAKVNKLVSPGISKMKVMKFALILPILFSIYPTFHLCTSKLSVDDIEFP